MADKKLIVNEKLCTGCMRCAIAYSKVFAMNDSYKAYVKNQKGDVRENIKNAIDICPVSAIFYI